MNLLKLKGFTNIYVVDLFEKEYRKLFNKDVQLWNQYQKRLRSKLKILDIYKEQVIDHLNSFESLRNSHILVIRQVGKINARILFAIVVEEKIVLLHVFEECNTSDYKQAVKTAEERLKVLGDFYETK